MSTTVHEAPCQPKYSVTPALPSYSTDILSASLDKRLYEILTGKKTAVLDLSVEFQMKICCNLKEDSKNLMFLSLNMNCIELTKTRVFNVTGVRVSVECWTTWSCRAEQLGLNVQHCLGASLYI